MNLFDPEKVRSGLIENIMREAGAPSIAGLIHKKNPHARVVALSGYKYYAADSLGGPDADIIMYFQERADKRFGPTAIPGHVPPADILTSSDVWAPRKPEKLGVGDHLAMQLANNTFKRLHQQVTMINLPEFDWPLGHGYGAIRDMRSATTLMQAFDRDLAALEDTYRKAGVLDKTLFVLTADHGFAPIYHTVPKKTITDAVDAAGGTIIRDTYHTGSYMWLREESAHAPQAAANISRLRNPYIQSVYFRSIGTDGPLYLRATGDDLFLAPGMEAANQHLLNTFNGPNGPDLVVFFKEHTAAVASGQTHWKGDHGGAAWESQHVPLILSGPGVRRGAVSTYPAKLMDVAPTALNLLGVPSTGMTGVVLGDSLTAPSKDVQAAQRVRTAQLAPIVSTLQSESRRELSARR
jgi:hypothetical protein